MDTPEALPVVPRPNSSPAIPRYPVTNDAGDCTCDACTFKRGRRA